MEIVFKANQKQKLALQYLTDKETSEIGYGGAAGGGKSYLGVFWVWMMCNTYPGTRYFFGRKELKRLKQSTLASYFKFLGDHNIPEANKGIYNAQESEIKFNNGSSILLLDMSYMPSDPLYTRFGSLELTGGFIDEANEIDEQCITIISTRIGRQKNLEYSIKPKLLMTFNPQKNWVYRKFYRPYKENQLPQYRVFIPALVKDNPQIDPNYIIQLEKADNITKQRLLYGNFEYDDTPNKLFKTDEVMDLFTNNINKSDIYYLSCDVARLGKDKTTIFVWRGLEVVDIVSYNGLTTDVTVDRIKELEIKYGIRRNHIIIDSDGVGGGVVDQLRGCKGFVNGGSAIQPFESKFNQDLKNNFGNLKTQCYFKLKELAEKGLIRINAYGELKDIICEELENILLKDSDKDGKILLESKEELKNRIGKSPDYADGLMMRMFYEIQEITSNEENNNLPSILICDYTSELL